MSNLLKIIKQAGVQAVDQGAPAAVMVGTVKQINPLVITVEQRLDIPAEFLLLTDNVRDYETELTIDETKTYYWDAPPEENPNRIDVEHKHAIEKRTVTIHNGLKAGEQVTLVRAQGGQKFIVLNRVVSA